MTLSMYRVNSYVHFLQQQSTKRIATKFKGPVFFTSESSISSTMGLKFRVGCGFVTVICYIFFCFAFFSIVMV